MKRITSRFVLLLAAAGILPLLVYGAVSIFSLRDATRRSVITGNENVARRVAEQIGLYIQTNVDILQSVAANLQGTNLEPWQQDRILKNAALDFPEFREIALYGPTGEQIASSRVGQSQVQFPQTGTGFGPYITVSPIAIDNDLLPTAIVGIKLTQAGQSAGSLVGEISLEEMWRMVDRIRVGQQGYALVVAQNGQLIAHGNPNDKARVARSDNLANQPLVRLVHGQRNTGPASLEYTSEAGVQMLGVAAPLMPLDWTVMVEQPRSEAYAVADQLTRQLIFIIGFALLVTVTVGYFFGRSFIRPIFELMRGTHAVAEGRLDERVTITSKDEFKQLGDAFNTMADKLVELTEDVRKKERQAMFGRMAAGLVHDLSHPVQNIGNSCKLIVRVFDDAEYRQTFTRTIDREMDTLKRVLDDLRNVARPAPVERFPLDVNRSIADIVESMRAFADESGVALEAKYSAEPVVIEGDTFALGRVYRNLITNAIQATQAGGRVTVATEKAGAAVQVSVTDTGSGIPAERLGAIFDDFVTTKKRGLGLGLAITKRIVEQLDGTIVVTSEIGKGTTFTMQFPAARRPVAVAAAAG
ncbi:MAG TPA: sensor histidine kinase [Vicinamibacterales bacterium]|nr:sensor histidine kinase [Vicinamibacterales bacterium]